MTAEMSVRPIWKSIASFGSGAPGPLPGAEPGRVEIAVGLAVIGQPRHVPVPDEAGIGGPDRRAAADIDHAAREARDDLLRPVARADRHHGPVLQCPGGKA